MWYFAWILGLPLAAMFAVINAMWLEMQSDRLMAQNAVREQQDKSQSGQ
ncbi:cytochrome bd-I oxidase subunit CydX [Parahaliea sp. F7430]|uniref:Cytochrome bd-I oxidase subunit CydX n=1 Tax=Sediminihaliea albiluteola TaxID=2758564 RepID=A0A7W2YJ46_9GAMM|nr:cytochrome bd-I oxidase subunit CydX [Sediminihaliea albiluteola]MBA6412249.1 cytochrome bd-I oxidase subunit CydX [Sediminihaliea albiluteola]